MGLVTMSFAQFATQPVATNLEEVLGQIEYPVEARVNGIEGDVEINVFVSKDGQVIRHEFTAEINPCLKASIDKVIQQLMFFPATDVNGEKVAEEVKIPVKFRLDIG